MGSRGVRQSPPGSYLADVDVDGSHGSERSDRRSFDAMSPQPTRRPSAHRGLVTADASVCSRLPVGGIRVRVCTRPEGASERDQIKDAAGYLDSTSPACMHRAAATAEDSSSSSFDRKVTQMWL